MTGSVYTPERDDRAWLRSFITANLKLCARPDAGVTAAEVAVSIGQPARVVEHELHQMRAERLVERYEAGDGPPPPDQVASASEGPSAVTDLPWWCCGGAPGECELSLAECLSEARQEETQAEHLAAADLDGQP